MQYFRIGDILFIINGFISSVRNEMNRKVISYFLEIEVLALSN